MQRTTAPVDPVDAYGRIRRAAAQVEIQLESHRARAVQAAVTAGATLAEVSADLRISKATAHRLSHAATEAPEPEPCMREIAGALEHMIWGGPEVAAGKATADPGGAP